jgi:ubiquinone biosynthesis accessory factor UbiJ
MLDALAAAAINHLLQGAAWARERMVPFAGASVRFHLPPASATFSIGEDGTLQPAASGVEPAASIRLTPALAVRLALLKDDSARAEVEVEGDAALAAALTRILGALSWDVEEDLSRVVGDVAAHRIGRAGRAFLDWQAALAANLARSVGEYLTEERAVVPGREALHLFAAAVDELRDDTQRLEKRIQRLASAARERG